MLVSCELLLGDLQGEVQSMVIFWRSADRVGQVRAVSRCVLILKKDLAVLGDVLVSGNCTPSHSYVCNINSLCFYMLCGNENKSVYLILISWWRENKEVRSGFDWHPPLFQYQSFTGTNANYKENSFFYSFCHIWPPVEPVQPRRGCLHQIQGYLCSGTAGDPAPCWGCAAAKRGVFGLAGWGAPGPRPQHRESKSESRAL